MDANDAALPNNLFAMRSNGNLLTSLGEEGGFLVTGLGRKVSIEFTAKGPKLNTLNLTLLDAPKVYVTVVVDTDTGVIKQVRQKPLFSQTGPQSGGKSMKGRVGGGSQGLLVAPPNDACLAAIAIGLGPTPFTTVDATTDGTTTCVGFAINKDTWFKYTAGGTGVLTAATCGSTTLDTLLAIYGSTACPTGASIACGDDNCGLQSSASALVTMGTTYLIRVGQFSSGTTTGSGTLTLSLVAPPANDQCPGATLIGCNSQTSATNVNATTAGDPAFTCKSTVHNTIWFKFVAVSSSAVVETTNSLAPVTDTVIAVYSGTCGALTQIGCDDDSSPNGFRSLLAVGGLIPGNTYYIQVAAWGSSGSIGTVTLDLSCAAIPTPGNACSDAIPTACGTDISFDNTLYTTDPTDPPFSCFFGGASQGFGTVWLTFVATHTSAKLDTNLSPGGDTELAVYSGTCGALTELCCSEDEGIGLLSEVCCTGLVVGNTYYVQVASFSSGSTGDITLNIECPCPAPPANDDCADAEDIPTLPASVTFNNAIATDDSPPACGLVTFGPFKNVWYTVTGTGNNITATTCNGGTVVTDTQISVFCGDCLDLNCVTGNDDFAGCGFRSSVTWCSQVGVTYFITVGNFSSSTVPGVIQLDVTEAAGACVPVVQCLPTGACCLVGGVCVTVTADDCAFQGGDYSGDGTSCTSDFMVDGSFEGGSPSATWTEASTNFGTPLCTVGFCGTGGGTGPRTGMWWAWFGGIPALEIGSLEQALTIPVGALSLDFFLEIFANSGNGVDFMRVKIDGGTVFTVLEGTAPYAGFGYDPVSIPLGAFADGGVHTIRFESTQTGSPGVTNFFVDDITMPVQTVSCITCYTLDFETDDTGGAIGDKQQLAGGEFDGGATYPVTLSSASYLESCGSIANTAAAYDSDAAPHGQDPDLAVDSGNILILQTDANLSFCSPGVYCSGNDDEDGGLVSFVFSAAGGVAPGSVDLIDVDSSGAFEVVTITLTDTLARTRTYTVPVNWTGDLVTDGGGNPVVAGIRTLNLNTLANQAGFGGSDATAVEDAGFDQTAVVSIVVDKGVDCPNLDGGSGALDNLTWCE